MTGWKEDFCRSLTAFFQAERSFLFAKGRVGLYAGLRAMNLPRGMKVLMPGYTCMVVPSAVQFAGLKPIYIDIAPETYNIRPELLEAVSYPDIAALIVQHTYGIPCEMDRLCNWAARRGIPIIEDSCHCFGSRFQGRLCGTFGCFAFMSGQWNKPFSTGLGGMLLINRPELVEAIEQLLEKELKQPSRLTNLLLWCQIVAHDLFFRPTTALLLTSAYRALTKMGLLRGSSSVAELRGRMPKDYFTGMAPCQVRRGLREMARITENIRHRTELTAFYHRELPGIGFSRLSVENVEELPLLRYPVRVANKAEVLQAALRKGVEIGSWFESPLHPEGTRLEDFGYRVGMCPEGERASREVINLPTHLKVSKAAAEKTLDFLKKFALPA